jgi:hypothetical protein
VRFRGQLLAFKNRFAAAQAKGIVHPLNEELGPHTGLTGVIVTYEFDAGTNLH